MLHVTLFAILNLLYFYIITFRSMCAVPSIIIIVVVVVVVIVVVVN